MKLPRLKVRTLLIGIAILAVLLEVVGLGQRSRRYAAKARNAAESERIDRAVVSNSRIYISQCLEEADKIAAKGPTKAADLRARAERSLRNIPFFEKQARRASSARAAYERAMTHPWESDPADVPMLGSTPPIGDP